MIKIPKIASVFLLGFASGLPLALSGSTLTAWFTEAGVSITNIGALSLIGLPYTLKWLWAPVMDRFTLPWLDRRRGWILLTQVCLAVLLFFMAFLDPKQAPMTLSVLALLLAFFSASQDIAFDAYRTDLLSVKERGAGASANIAAYRVAMLVSGGHALVLAQHFGWALTYHIMAIMMLLTVLFTWLSPDLPFQPKSPKSIWQLLQEGAKEYRSRQSAWFLLLFIVFYKLADAFALTLNVTFLLRELGFSLQEVGLIYKTLSLVAMLLGSTIGGLFINRLGLYRALWYFGIVQALSVSGFLGLAFYGKSYILMLLAVFIENFTGGLGSIALVAFLMALCDQRYTATQFAFFTSLAAVGRVLIGPLSGVTVSHLGWVTYYIISISLAIPGLCILFYLKHRIDWQADQIGVIHG